MRLIGLVVLAVLLTGCDSSSYVDGKTDAQDSSSLACDHFRNIASDVSQGLMTDAEMREKLKEVHDNSSIGTPKVQRAATAMLAAATSGDYGQLGNAVTRMGNACTAAGS